MVWLGNLFVSLVSAIAGYFGIALAKRTLFALAALSAMLALTATFVIAVKALLLTIQATLPGWAAVGFQMFMPFNLSACIGAYFSARVARWIYDYHMTGLKLASYIT